MKNESNGKYDLPELAGAAVQRALAARQGCTDLSSAQTDLVGGALQPVNAVSQMPLVSRANPIWIGLWSGLSEPQR